MNESGVRLSPCWMVRGSIKFHRTYTTGTSDEWRMWRARVTDGLSNTPLPTEPSWDYLPLVSLSITVTVVYYQIKDHMFSGRKEDVSRTENIAVLRKMWRHRMSDTPKIALLNYWESNKDYSKIPPTRTSLYYAFNTHSLSMSLRSGHTYIGCYCPARGRIYRNISSSKRKGCFGG